MDTQQGSEPPEPPVRTKEWERMFERQLSAPDFIAALRVYARHRAALVARYRRIDQLYADDLVQDVLHDTWEGTIVWDPARVDLKKHVRDAIKSRSRHDYLHAKRFRHDHLDPDAPRVEAELAAQHARVEERVALRQRACAIIDALRALAEDDPEVLILLDAYERHATKRDDVLELTKLTARQYKAARDRLVRLRDSLPHHLKPTL